MLCKLIIKPLQVPSDLLEFSMSILIAEAYLIKYLFN